MSESTCVEWVDSSSSYGWVDKETVKAKINTLGRNYCKVTSYGLIVYETEEVIVLTTTETDNEWDCPLVIPKVCIIKRTDQC